MENLKHRKSAIRLQLLNKDGTPVVNQSVKIDQTSHRFLFGCGAFDALAMLSTEDTAEREFLKERVDKWLGLFNYGTLPFYWGRYEPEEGMTGQESLMKTAK